MSMGKEVHKFKVPSANGYLLCKRLRDEEPSILVVAFFSGY